MCPIIRWSIGVVVIALVGATPQARAQSNSRLYDKWQIDLSGAVVIMGTNIRVDGENGEGTEVDGEDVLGLSQEKFQPRASVRWRPGRRHEIELGYQFARRTAEKTLERDITFGDSIYTVGVNVKSNFHTDQAFLVYRFAIQAHERTQLGVGVGVGVLPFKLQIDRLASAGGAGVTSSREKSFTGPTGSLGVYGRFLLGDRWYLESDLRGIAIQIDRIDAKIVEGNVAGRYLLSDELGIELGYGISSVTLTVDPPADRKGFFGKIKYPLQNIRLGVVLTP
jgi:hypothetical protein